jgi:hypothetical protein
VAIGYCCSAKWCNGLQLTQSVGSLYSHQPAVTSPSESGLQIGNWLRSHWIHCIDRLGGCDYLSRYSKQLEMRSRKREQVKESDRLRVTKLIEDASKAGSEKGYSFMILCDVNIPVQGVHKRIDGHQKGMKQVAEVTSLGW